MNWYMEILHRFRRTSTSTLVCTMSSKFAFGFGLGALLAATVKGDWKRIGAVTMLASLVVAVPAVVEVFREE